MLGLTTSGLAVFGFGVAIPWEIARGLAETIATHGKVPRGYLGVAASGLAVRAASDRRAWSAAAGAARSPRMARRRGLVLQGDILVRMEASR